MDGTRKNISLVQNYVRKGLIFLSIFCLFQRFSYTQLTSSVIVSGDVVIQIGQGTATSEPAPVIDENTTLRYAAGLFSWGNMRITINATIQNNRQYGLMAEAIRIDNANGGVAQGAIDLTIISQATNFITNIAWLSGTHTCNVRYTASARYQNGYTDAGSNTVYTVTYTILTN
jgi:hypothetical protein